MNARRTSSKAKMFPGKFHSQFNANGMTFNFKPPTDLVVHEDMANVIEDEILTVLSFRLAVIGTYDPKTREKYKRYMEENNAALMARLMNSMLTK